MTDENNQQITTSLLVVIGGSCLLAVLAIGVSLMTSLRERQDEFALSRRAGASPALVHRSTLIESVAVLAIAFALGAAVVPWCGPDWRRTSSPPDWASRPARRACSGGSCSPGR